MLRVREERHIGTNLRQDNPKRTGGQVANSRHRIYNSKSRSEGYCANIRAAMQFQPLREAVQVPGKGREAFGLVGCEIFQVGFSNGCDD